MSKSCFLGKNIQQTTFWNILFLIFPYNRLCHFMQIVSIGDNLHKMSKLIVWGKIKKILSVCRLLNWSREWKSFKRLDTLVTFPSIFFFFFFFFFFFATWCFLAFLRSCLQASPSETGFTLSGKTFHQRRKVSLLLMRTLKTQANKQVKPVVSSGNCRPHFRRETK